MSWSDEPGQAARIDHDPETACQSGHMPTEERITDPDRMVHNPFAGESSSEIMTAFAAIPADSVTARTAGALRVESVRYTIEEERAAFERGVADENA